MHLQAVLDSLPANLRPPTNCPTCGTALVIEDAWVTCPNFDCANRIYGRLQKFVNVLDIKGAGIETLRGLVQSGLVKTPADLFNVTEDQFCKLDRKGEKHYAKFRQGLDTVKTLRTPQIFASLDIEGIGTWDAICCVPGLQTPQQVMDCVKTNNWGLLSNAVRVSPEKAQKIIGEITTRKAEVEGLLSKIQVKQTATKLVGKTFCITGTLSIPRPKIEELIKANGGQVGGSVTNKTTYLLTDDPNSGSSKNKKAQQLGVAIISEAQFRDLLK